MNIKENSYLVDKSELSEPMTMTISKYRNYPSILLIKDKIRNPASFSFKEVCLSDIEKIKKSQHKNGSTFGNIPPKKF